MVPSDRAVAEASRQLKAGEGSALIGALGGTARANALTPERRREIAAMGGRAGGYGRGIPGGTGRHTRNRRRGRKTSP